MKGIAFASICIVGLVVPTTAFGGKSTSHTTACATRVETIRGKRVTVNCGPATAVLHYKGKTYSLRNGTCIRAVGPSIKLYLGSELFDTTKGNIGFSELDLTMLAGGAMNVTIAVGKLTVAEAATYRGTVKAPSRGSTARSAAPGAAAARSGRHEELRRPRSLLLGHAPAPATVRRAAGLRGQMTEAVRPGRLPGRMGRTAERSARSPGSVQKMSEHRCPVCEVELAPQPEHSLRWDLEAEVSSINCPECGELLVRAVPGEPWRAP